MPRQGTIGALLFVVVLTGCTVHNYLDPGGPRHAGAVEETPPDPEPDRIRAVTFNVQYAAHVDEAIARLRGDPSLRDADVVMLQEMNASATRRIAEALGFHHVFYASALVREQLFGVAVVSRWPIVEHHKVRLPHGDPLRGVRRIAIGTTLDTPDGPLIVYSAHLETIVLSLRGRLDQTQAILDDIVERHGYLGAPVIVGGDFNTPEAYGREAIRDRFRLHGLRHATRSLTATADYVFGTLLLDHVFARDLELVDAGAEPTVASDHRPTFVVLERRDD